MSGHAGFGRSAAMRALENASFAARRQETRPFPRTLFHDGRIADDRRAAFRRYRRRIYVAFSA